MRERNKTIIFLLKKLNWFQLCPRMERERRLYPAMRKMLSMHKFLALKVFWAFRNNASKSIVFSPKFNLCSILLDLSIQNLKIIQKKIENHSLGLQYLKFTVRILFSFFKIIQGFGSICKRILRRKLSSAFLQLKRFCFSNTQSHFYWLLKLILLGKVKSSNSKKSLPQFF